MILRCGHCRRKLRVYDDTKPNESILLVCNNCSPRQQKHLEMQNRESEALALVDELEAQNNVMSDALAEIVLSRKLTDEMTVSHFKSLAREAIEQFEDANRGRKRNDR